GRRPRWADRPVLLSADRATCPRNCGLPRGRLGRAGEDGWPGFGRRERPRLRSSDGPLVAVRRQGASQSVDRDRLVAAPAVARDARYQPDQARRALDHLGLDRARLRNDALLLVGAI